MQAMNDLHLVLHSEECESFRQGGEWTFVNDGGWDHNSRNREVQLALTLDHSDRECTFIASVVCAARMLSWNKAAPKRSQSTSHTEGTLARGCVVAC